MVGAIAPAQCQIAAPAVVTASHEVPPLDGHVEVLIDPSRALRLDDVLGISAAFEPLAGHSLNLGYTRNAAWLRLTIVGTATERVLLSLSPNFVDLMDVYVAPPSQGFAVGDFIHHAMGDHRPLPVDAVSGLDNVVPLHLVVGETTLVYLRVAGVNSSLNVSVALDPVIGHTQRVTSTTLTFGAWFGGMLVLIAIQLVFYLFDRKFVYLLLACSALSAILVYMGNLGLSRVLLFPAGGVANDYFTAGAVWFGLFIFAITTDTILELRRLAPWLHKTFAAGAGIGLFGIVCALLDANPTFAPIGNVVILLLSALAMAQSLRNADENGMTTRLTAAAYMILWLGLIATLLQRGGLVPLPNWVAHSYGVSCIIHLLLLTGALAVRLRAAEAMNRVMSEQALMAAQQAEQQAHAMVEEKTCELAAAKTVAEDALRAELHSQGQQVRFMEVISHQIRTPLTTIRTNADMIGLSLQAGDDSNRSRLDRIRRAIVWLVEMLEVNLARSRLQGPSFQPRLALMSLSALAASAAARGRDLTQGCEICLDIAPGSVGARLLADAEMLGIATLNLLDNAVKYSALAGASPVMLSCAVEAGNGIIAVSDQGIGIPADEIAGILGHSVRGSNAQSVEGSGMGLSLVSRIVAAHGGTVEVDSAVGGGTTIRMILPTVQA